MAKTQKILVVDDDAPLLEMYKERLQIAGYDVETASNGEDGIEKAKQIKPDLVLLDIMMPRVNGFDALQKMRQDPATAKTPVLMLTALVQESTKQRAQQAGAQGYIVKSETMPGEVIKKIQETISAAK